MENPNYLRTKFTVKDWKETGNEMIRLELVPDTVHGVSDNRHFICETPNNLFIVTLPNGSPIAGQLKRGAAFYLDLIPAEVASAVGRG